MPRNSFNTRLAQDSLVGAVRGKRQAVLCPGFGVFYSMLPGAAQNG